MIADRGEISDLRDDLRARRAGMQRGPSLTRLRLSVVIVEARHRRVPHYWLRQRETLWFGPRVPPVDRLSRQRGGAG
jgi:hypothetical protein